MSGDWSLLVLLGGLLIAPQAVAKDEPAETIPVAAKSLDDGVKSARTAQVAPILADLLHLEKSLVEQLLAEKTNKISDIVLAQFVAEQTKKPFDAVWQTKEPWDWPKLLTAKKIKEIDAVDRLNYIYAEVSFKLLDEFENRQKEKP